MDPRTSTVLDIVTGAPSAYLQIFSLSFLAWHVIRMGAALVGLPFIPQNLWTQKQFII